MQKEKEYNSRDLVNTSQQTNMMPIGSDQIWLEFHEKLKGMADFTTNLPEINTLTEFVATPPKKKSEKINVHVRRKDNNRGELF